MFCVQITDRARFAEQAKRQGIPVAVSRTTTVVPVTAEDGLSVTMHPALLLEYRIEFFDKGTEFTVGNGETRWVLRETLLADEQGVVELANTLWSELQDHKEVKHVLRGGF